MPVPAIICALLRKMAFFCPVGVHRGAAGGPLVKFLTPCQLPQACAVGSQVLGCGGDGPSSGEARRARSSPRDTALPHAEDHHAA